MKSPESVEMSPISAIQVYTKLVQFKATGDKMKSIKRITRAIKADPIIEVEDNMVRITDLKAALVFIPMLKKDRIILWDVYKEDLSAEHSLADEEFIEALAKSLGKTDDFEAPVADTEPDEGKEEETKEETKEITPVE